LIAEFLLIVPVFWRSCHWKRFSDRCQEEYFRICFGI